VEEMHRHVAGLQQRLLSVLPSALSERLVPPAGAEDRGHFLTFQLPRAEQIYRRLHERRVITDYRSDRWRVGLGIYHDAADIERLADEIRAII
jgi:kynureninase